MTLLCQVYKSPLREETYLYVDRRRGLADVPEALLQSFGEPAEILVLALSPQRRLARANAAQVLAAIENQGYYLQLPPTPVERWSRKRVDD